MLIRPNRITVAFGAEGLRNAIPVTKGSAAASNLADYTRGFPQITMTAKTAGGMPPFGRDINGILYEITDAIRYAQSGMFFPFDSDFAASVGYEKGAIILRSDGGLLQSVTNNATSPDSAADWQPINSGVTTVTVSNQNVTLTTNQAAAPILIIQGALTANVTIFLPLFLRSWVVLNNATGNYKVTIKTASGSGVAVKNASKNVIFCDGLNILSLTNEGDKIPAGTCIMYAGRNVPEGWLLRDGRAVSRLLYPELFAAIGTTYGGDGATFNLPNDIEYFDRGGGVDKLGVRAQGSIQSHTHGITQQGHTHGITQTPHAHAASQAAHSHGASQAAHTHTQNAHNHNRGNMNITGSFFAHDDNYMGGAKGAFSGRNAGGGEVESGYMFPPLNEATVSFDASKTWTGSTNSVAPGINSARPAITVNDAQPAVTVNPANANVTVNSATIPITINSAGGAETAPMHSYKLPLIKY